MGSLSRDTAFKCAALLFAFCSFALFIGTILGNVGIAAAAGVIVAGLVLVIATRRRKIDAGAYADTALAVFAYCILAIWLFFLVTGAALVGTPSLSVSMAILSGCSALSFWFASLVIRTRATMPGNGALAAISSLGGLILTLAWFASG